MKKSLLKITVILFILPFSILRLSGQEPEPYYDCKIMCPDIEWEEQEPLLFPGIGPDFLACNYVVYWSYRYLDCPGLAMNWCDFKIDTIKCPGCPPSCLENMSYYTLTHKKIEDLLKAKAKFTPCAQALEPGDSTSFISINFSSCWIMENGDPSMNQFEYLIPCDESQCCRQVWKIIKYQFGGFSDPILIATLGINPVCPNTMCIAVCEEFVWPTIPSNLEINEDTGHSFKTTVYPNPSADLINLIIESETEGEITIEINDVLGNAIITKNIIKNEREIQLQFKMSSYSNGNYYYVIKHNGKQVLSGSFNIIK